MMGSLGDLGDFIGGIAVVVTLIYLASQIRNNTHALRAASRQDVSSTTRQWLGVMNDVGSDYSIGLREFPDVSATQKRRFAYGLSYLINALQEICALYESGALDRDTYEAHLTGLACHLVTPGGSAFWQDQKHFQPSAFAKVIDERIAAGGLTDLLLGNPFFQLDEST
jgi:hypothetical protein